MTLLETAKERLLDMQKCDDIHDLRAAGIIFRRALMNAHEASGRTWDSWQLDACRWCLNDSMIAEIAFQEKDREHCFQLLVACRENIGRLLGEPWASCCQDCWDIHEKEVPATIHSAGRHLCEKCNDSAGEKADEMRARP